MNEISLDQKPNTFTSNKFLPVILLLFFGSGCAALIYEIVWFQLLQLMIGSSAVSLGVLLGIYMGGMCLGSLAFPRIVSARRNPLRAYAILELLIGICGVAVLYAIPYVDKFYISHAAEGFMGIAMRGAVCAMCLLPPTFLMGATLPAIARWVESTPKGVSWLGVFYAGNIIGAVFGCLLAGFYLLRVHDMFIATYTALGFNLLVSISGLMLAGAANYKIPVSEINKNILRTSGRGTVYFVIALSGFTALGAEVVWTRLLSLMLGATVYSFSIILAVFLVGLGIGSSIGAFISGNTQRPRFVLGLCQLFLCAAVAWSAFIISKSLPYWPIDPSISTSPWYIFQLDIVRCLWAILPPACLWGASFPLALASVVSPGQDSGRITGSVYASNTVGAILGSLVFSMIIVPNYGTQQSQRIIMLIAAGAALIMLLPVIWPFGEKDWFTGKPKSVYARFVGIISLTVSAIAVAALVYTVSSIPWGAIAYGRFMATMGYNLKPGIVKIEDIPANGSYNDTYCIYAAEGKNVSVAVTRTPSGRQSFHGAGKVQASNDPLDMKLQRMLGHISALLNKDPKNVLVVACGAGVTAGSFVPHPEVEKITIVDIEPMVPKNVAPFFATENFDVVNSPKTTVIVDDGRHFIHTTKEKFDVITSDPIDPWVKGCAALNTIEYYQMCKEHLNPGGVMALWMPFYESSEETTKSLITTFFKVFPDGIIWSNDDRGQGYDAVLFGQVGGTQINIDELQAKLNDEAHRPVKESLQFVGFNSLTDLLATYAGQAGDMVGWMQGAQINEDKNLRLQFIAGMWFNSYIEKDILNNIFKYYKFPNNIFKGSEENIASLKQSLEATGRVERN